MTAVAFLGHFWDIMGFDGRQWERMVLLGLRKSFQSKEKPDFLGAKVLRRYRDKSGDESRQISPNKSGEIMFS